MGRDGRSRVTLCKVDGCGRKHKGLGYCNAHYLRTLRGTPLTPDVAPPYPKGRQCSVEGCGKKHIARGYCDTHYMALVVRPTGYRWIEKNPERHAANWRRWRREHPARANAISRWRQWRVKRATPAWLSDEQWDAMDAKYVEARQLTEATGIEHQVDHIDPIAGKNSCGLHVPWNLQIMTGLANRRKANRAA